MKKMKSPFRWWFVIIWLVGIGLFSASIASRENLIMLIVAFPTLALPVLLWILNAKRNKRIKEEEQKRIDDENAEKAAKEAWEAGVRTVSFTAQNADQEVLSKLYKEQENDDLMLPDCVLYQRENGYAIYVDSDRVGDIQGDVAAKLKEYAEKYKLLGVPYDIYFGEETDESGEPLFSIDITVRFHE